MRRLLALPAVLVLAACGAGTVDVGDVTSRAERVVEEQLGGVDAAVDCPGDLPAEVGAELRCSVTAEDVPDAYGLTVTVTSVEDGRAAFDVVVDDQPSG